MPVNTNESQGKPRRVTVLHIEDDSLWAVAIANTIGQWPQFRLVGTVPTGAAGIARCRELPPEIVILDLRLPDMDGFAVLEAIRARAVSPRVLFLTCRNDDFALNHTAADHIAGMLFKSPDYDRELRSALDAIARGGRYFSGTVQAVARRSRAVPDAFFKILSNREIDVLKLIASGFADHEIAASLAIGGSTVCSHRQRIMDKIGVHSSAKLVRWAHEKGFGMR